MYALDSNIFNPLPEPLFDKMLNFTAMIAIIPQKEWFLYIKIKKMQNIPRIFISHEIEPGKSIAVDKDVVHYLRRVMRRDDCLVFNGGDEYIAKRLAVRLFHLDETVPVVTVGVVEDDGVAPCKLLELSLPVDFQRRGANDECR